MGFHIVIISGYNMQRCKVATCDQPHLHSCFVWGRNTGWLKMFFPLCAFSANIAVDKWWWKIDTCNTCWILSLFDGIFSTTCVIWRRTLKWLRMMNWKGCERKRTTYILKKYYPRIFVEGLRITMKNVGKDSWHLGWKYAAEEIRRGGFDLHKLRTEFY